MIRFTLNGASVEVQDGESRTLLEFLRNVRCMKGTKEACGTGHCGACSVLVDGKLTRSCVTMLRRVDGKTVETIENAPNDAMLPVIQRSFLDVGAVQCGFCTPGMVMAAKALLLHDAAPDEPAIYDGLKNNYCRCTGYVKIIEAVKLAAARLRGETPTCRPEFTDGKYLRAEEVIHPLIGDCVPNTLELDGTGLLLTGSNMSGKTTFIRTLVLNALLAETLDICFAEAYTAPYMKIYSSIRISDDIAEGTSYYLQEVLTVKRFIDASQEPAPCLFALDELFKGTNTTERIAAGKAVLAHLNRGPHLVLVSTHDVELADLLRKDGYELHHFREEVIDGKLVFDYQLHTGPLTTRNAIRILEMYDYPRDLIAEAYEVQEKLTEKSN